MRDLLSVLRLLLAAVLATACVAAGAQTSGNIPINANVTAACTITVAALQFGSYSSLTASPLRVGTTLSVTCSQGSIATVALGPGNSVTGGQRRMANTGASAYLNYSLFKPATNAANAACAYTASWGDGTAVGTTFATTAAPNLSARTYNVCGEIPAGQNVPVDAYSDSVTASVTF